MNSKITNKPSERSCKFKLIVHSSSNENEMKLGYFYNSRRWICIVCMCRVYFNDSSSILFWTKYFTSITKHKFTNSHERCLIVYFSTRINKTIFVPRIANAILRIGVSFWVCLPSNQCALHHPIHTLSGSDNFIRYFITLDDKFKFVWITKQLLLLCSSVSYVTAYLEFFIVNLIIFNRIINEY